MLHHGCVRVLSHVSLFATPQPVAHQAPLSMGSSRQEYWSELSFPPPGDLPHLNIYVQLRKLENIIWGRHHNLAHLALISYSPLPGFTQVETEKSSFYLAFLNLAWSMSYNTF